MTLGVAPCPSMNLQGQSFAPQKPLAKQQLEQSERRTAWLINACGWVVLVVCVLGGVSDVINMELTIGMDRI